MLFIFGINVKNIYSPPFYLTKKLHNYYKLDVEIKKKKANNKKNKNF